MPKIKTNKEHLETLQQSVDELRKSIPNGDLQKIQIILELISTKQGEIVTDIAEVKLAIEKIHRKLYNPEDGVVVRVNKNTEHRRDSEKQLEKGTFAAAQTKIEKLWDWKNTVNRALWVVYAAVIGFLLKLVFFGGVSGSPIQ